MAKLYKVEFFLTDHEDRMLDIKVIETQLENFSYQSWGDIHVADIKESKGFDWDDDLRINNINATTEDYEKYFK